MGRIFFQNKKDDAFRAAPSYRQGRFKKYIACLLFLILAVLAAWFIRIMGSKQAITEFSSDYVALAELPSQLSFTYYGEKEWEGKLKEFLHKKSLDGKLTYGKLKLVLEQLSVLEYVTYEEKFFWKAIPRKCWNQIYEQILGLLDTSEKVSVVGLVFLDEEGEGHVPQECLTQKGYFQVADGINYFHHYDMYQVYVVDDRIIGVIDKSEEKLTLENAFVHHAQAGEAEILYENQKISLDIAGLDEKITDTICDIQWEDGKVTGIYKKEEKITGTVLSFDEQQIEISGYGILEYSGKLKVYKTYGTVEELDESKLVIGNLKADFVVAKKQVCGVILQEPATIENIRVLLLNAENGTHHDNPILTADTGGTVFVGDKEQAIEPGQPIKAADLLKDNVDYVKIELNGKAGRIYFADENGAQTSLGYRGAIEIRKYTEGYGVVNELPLEQYLYGVVPSEMPATYERDALCTQAICARSYACIHLMRGDYAALGAHVDDSTSYQVYNKQAEDEKTNLAVDDTVGEVIKYQGEIAEAYYFSTSCGFSGDMAAWNEEGKESQGYLRGISLLADGSEPDISDEDKFAEFIKDQDVAAYDSDSTYFRWTANLSFKEKADAVNNAISVRFEANAKNVQIKKADGTEGTAADLASFGAPEKVTVEERCTGGAVKQLNIAYEKGNVTLFSEYNVRTVLGAAATNVTGKDGEPVDMALLPSAYCSVTPTEEGFVVYGGGYGHGIGMSQNGANGMAKAGMNYVEILTTFYNDIDIENIYNEEK